MGKVFFNIDGYLLIKISGAEAKRFLNLCVFHQIELWEIDALEDGFLVKMSLADFWQIAKLVRKTKVKVVILERHGLPFLLHRAEKRKILVLGPFFCLFFLWYISRFLWAVEFQGNTQLTEDMLTDFLTEQGIYYGLPLKELDIEALKVNLRRNYEVVNWTSANLDGTKLIVRIKENDLLPVVKEETIGEASNLIASRDGVVRDIVTREGVPMVKTGDEIKKGDLLIEGRVPIMGDDGTPKDYLYCHADGDVSLQHELEIKEEISRKYRYKRYSGAEKKKYFLKIGKSIYGMDIRKPPFLTYDVVENSTQWSLFGQIELPVIWVERIYRDYTVGEEKYPEETCKKMVQDNFEKNMQSLEEKGVQIIGKNVRIVSNSVMVGLYGTITVCESDTERVSIEAEPETQMEEDE